MHVGPPFGSARRGRSRKGVEGKERGRRGGRTEKGETREESRGERGECHHRDQGGGEGGGLSSFPGIKHRAGPTLKKTWVAAQYFSDPIPPKSPSPLVPLINELFWPKKKLLLEAKKKPIRLRW